MSRKRKKSKAVPVVTTITVLVILLCAACFFAGHFVDSQRKAAEDDLAARQEAVQEKNRQIEAEYAARLAELESQTSATASTSWPAHKNEGWDILDLTNYPLENQTAQAMTRAEVMNNGMLLVNQWHSRPDDFDESTLVSVGRYLGGNNVVQVDNYNINLFPIAADALKEAVEAARAEDLDYFIVQEGYRSWDAQNTLFQAQMDKLSSRYSGDDLVEHAKRSVNYPGTSEYNTGLAFRLGLYKKNDPEVTSAVYVNTSQGRWMNENGWKYGIIFRFPQNEWPLETSTDKSFKTGISQKLLIYRYVGKGNAAIMHYLDLCLEEYIEYLEEHPHIALFEDGILKYEIYRQIVGDDATFNVQLTRNARSWVTSLDNMGALVTVFEY